MKKIIVIILSLAILFSCVACNSSLHEVVNHEEESTELTHTQAPETIDQISLPNDMLVAPAMKNDLWGFIDTSGNWVIKPQFDSLNDYSEGYALVEKNGLFGFINTNGEIIIEPQFTRANSFSEGLACVMRDGMWGFINNEGEMIIEPQFDLKGDFTCGFAQVSYQKDAVLINKEGEVAFSFGRVWPQLVEDWSEKNQYLGGFGEAENFADNIKNGIVNCFYFEYIGEELSSYTKLFNIDTEQYLPGLFYGHAMWLIDDVFVTLATVDSPARLINKEGIDVTSKYIKREDIKFILPFHEGLAAIETYDGLWGFININGEVVIEPQFEATLWFTTSRAPIMRTDAFDRELWGYIDTAGNIVVTPQYNVMTITETFNDGLALVKEYEFDGNHEWIDEVCYQYIDIDGNIVIQLTADVKANSFVNGYARITKGNVGFINTTGELVIDFNYEDAGDFQYVDSSDYMKVTEDPTNTSMPLVTASPMINSSDTADAPTPSPSPSFAIPNDDENTDPEDDKFISKLKECIYLSDVENLLGKRGHFVDMYISEQQDIENATFAWSLPEKNGIVVANINALFGDIITEVEFYSGFSIKDTEPSWTYNTNDIIEFLQGKWAVNSDPDDFWEIEILGCYGVFFGDITGDSGMSLHFFNVLPRGTNLYDAKIIVHGVEYEFEVSEAEDTFMFNGNVYTRK